MVAVAVVAPTQDGVTIQLPMVVLAVAVAALNGIGVVEHLAVTTQAVAVVVDTMVQITAAVVVVAVSSM